MKDILPKIESSLPEAVSKVLKSEGSLLDQTMLSTPTPASLAISYDIEGASKGQITILFTAAESVAKRFLTITIGDPEAASIEESCQEVGNQILGISLGALSNDVAEIRLAAAGRVVTPESISNLTDQTNNYLARIGTKEYGDLLMYYSIESENTEITSPAAEIENTRNEMPIKVMIVDDSPVMCAFLKKIFIEKNYDIVAVAEDGIEALEKFQQYHPELVTLDIMMPKMKGTDVLKEIMTMAPDTTVVMASSIADAKTVMNCLRIGAKRYIVKPYDKDAVISAIDKALTVRKTV